MAGKERETDMPLYLDWPEDEVKYGSVDLPLHRQLFEQATSSERSWLAVDSRPPDRLASICTDCRDGNEVIQGCWECTNGIWDLYSSQFYDPYWWISTTDSQDCLNGVEKAIDSELLDMTQFDPDTYRFYETVE